MKLSSVRTRSSLVKTLRTHIDAIAVTSRHDAPASARSLLLVALDVLDVLALSLVQMLSVDEDVSVGKE